MLSHIFSNTHIFPNPALATGVIFDSIQPTFTSNQTHSWDW